MPRPDKVQAVQEIKERFEEAAAVFLTEYRGLSTAEQQELRRRLREAEADYKVVKMSLARRAVDELELAEMIELLSGPTALAFTQSDAVVAAKALQDFAKEHGALLIKGGLLRGQLLPPEKVTELAELEPREVLLAKTAGAFQAPLAGLAGLMQALTRNTATVLSQLLERRQEAGPDDVGAHDVGAHGSALEEETAEAPDVGAHASAPEEEAAPPEEPQAADEDRADDDQENQAEKAQDEKEEKEE